jgi:hypothetical protein
MLLLPELGLLSCVSFWHLADVVVMTADVCFGK